MADNESRSKLPPGLEWFEASTDLKLLSKSFCIPVSGTDAQRIEKMSMILSFYDDNEESPPRPNDYPMSKLNAHQLKKIARKLGYKVSDKTRMNDCLVAIFTAATSKDGLTLLVNEGIASKQRSLTAKAILVNRLITVLFHPVYRPSFTKMNAYKGHTDIEVTMGPNNKYFWHDVMDCVNDNDNPEEIVSQFLPMAEDFADLDRYIKYMYEARDESPSHPVSEPATVKTLGETLKQLLNVRQIIETNMCKKTGENENDVWNFTEAALSKAGVARKMTRFSAYYFFLLCAQNETVLKTLTKSLPKKLTGSNVSMDGEAKTPRSSRKEELQSLTNSMAENAANFAAISREQHRDRSDEKKASHFEKINPRVHET
jgi:hypothetical protein